MEHPELGALVPYVYATGTEVRTALGPDGEAWFVLADLCKVLDIRNPRAVASRLDDDEVGTAVIESRGKREAAIVSEAGTYDLILRSNRPEARALRRWITREVLPSIRRHGFYIETERRAGLAQAAVMSKNALNEIRTLAPTHPDQGIAKRLSAAAETIDKRTIAPVEWLAGAEGFDAIGTAVPDRLQAQLDAPPHDMS